MTISFPDLTFLQGVNLMRHAGYSLERARDTGEISFARRVHGTPFPRYHAYTEDRGGSLLVKLHLDQKAPSYGGSSAHAGEYEGETLEKEAVRIKRIAEHGGALNAPDID